MLMETLAEEVRTFLGRVEAKGGGPNDYLEAALNIIVHTVRTTPATTSPRESLLIIVDQLRRIAEGESTRRVLREDELELVEAIDLLPHKPFKA